MFKLKQLQEKKGTDDKGLISPTAGRPGEKKLMVNRK